ncbi:unnamed protein product [Closterium sp. NIES-53]
MVIPEKALHPLEAVLPMAIPPPSSPPRNGPTRELYGNNISGSIPAGISKLPNLVYLLLGSNNMTGAAPVTHANLSYL